MKLRIKAISVDHNCSLRIVKSAAGPLDRQIQQEQIVMC